MKKCVLVLILFVLAVSVHSQTISIDLNLWQHNSVFRGVVSTSTFLPSIGVAYDTSPMELLAEIEFLSAIVNMGSEVFGSKISGNVSYFSIAAGIAPKFEVTDKLFFTFPILGNFSRVGGKVDFESEVTGLGVNSFGIDLGMRAHYILNQNWSVFAGAKTKAINYGGDPKIKVDSTSESYDLNLLQFFVSGSFSLGIRYSF